MNVDYSKYSIEELLDVKRNIKPEVAPNNYKNLLLELENRSEEIEIWKSKFNEEKSSSSIKLIKIIAYYQILGSLILLLSLFSYFNLLSILLAIFSFISGWLLNKESEFGINLSIIIQFLQLPLIISNSFIYGSSTIGGLYICILQEFELSILTKFDPGFVIQSGEFTANEMVGINILSIAALYVLIKWHYRN